ncbi:tyrosinase [Fusarium beomiforme]|uniref:tyrosinase n=1 Tax=Fusarium beomiforme TaxID=44412 RepID=A0A9P5DM27_9HYPO|nr:tyrosinase [Fusarium beomiforme]
MPPTTAAARLRTAVKPIRGVRRSLQELTSLYNSGDRTILENLVRAFRKIQELPFDHPDSFFVIAGYHGEPFVEEDPTNPGWWGGYCKHQTVLFPTWHRAYLYRLENALRNALPEATDLALPFWDECLSHGMSEPPIPWILTARKLPFPVDGKTDNPLFSYTLQKDLVDNHNVKDPKRYSKPAGYQTVRYPLSGLVGNEKDKEETRIHNDKYLDENANIKILNDNVKAWMDSTVKIPDDDKDPPTRKPDTYSVYARFQTCLKAPNYTVFSNKDSMAQYIKDHKNEGYFGVSLEEPHNAIHLALGGFYQKGEYNLDPIFYLHHAFIDYTFWEWQRRHGRTAAGSLEVVAGMNGTISLGDPAFKKGTALNMDSPIEPFKDPNGNFYTSKGVTDIEKLGYTYGPGSLDMENKPALHAPHTEPIANIINIRNINRSDYSGSFVIRTHAHLLNGDRVEIGREAVLSRWNVAGCANCQDHLNENSFITLDEKTKEKFQKDEKDDTGKKIKLSVEIQTRRFEGGLFSQPQRRPIIEWL